MSSDGDDYLTQEEALAEVVKALFTEYGPQINIDSKKLIEKLWGEIEDGLDAEEREIASVALVAGCLNGILTMALERWGISTTTQILGELKTQYENYLKKIDTLN